MVAYLKRMTFRLETPSMLKILLPSALLAFSAAAGAQSLSDTHERVSPPGKTFSHYRPIKHTPPVNATCHPEASKARGCLAIARARALEQAAQADAAREARTLAEASVTAQ